MAVMEREYNPVTAAPKNIHQSRLFADAFDGIRPSSDFPLSFETIGIKPGWAPWGNLTDDITTAIHLRIPSVHFWDRITVPAFPLRVMDGSLTELQYRLLIKQLLNKELDDVIKVSGLNPVTHIVFRIPDDTWIHWPVDSDDFHKSDELIRRELIELSTGSYTSEAKTMRLGMKRAIWYIYTGQTDI